MRSPRASIASLIIGSLFAQSADASSNPADCEALAASTLFPDTAVSAATVVPADESRRLPAYCEVTASVTPVRGSNITVVYRLPQNWNGRMLGIGGGGWAGDTRLENPRAVFRSADGLAKGYATAQTNGGHDVDNVWDTAWSVNPEAVTDFNHRAIHVMTVIGKQVVAKYYGRPHERAYFYGCSTGGRQGLMEVQRYPKDYDGVIAGAPVYSLATQTSLVVRNQILASADANLTDAQLERLNEAALAACDSRDGLVDGIITDPRTCTFDPGALQCATGRKTDGCLTPAQVTAVRALYAGTRTSRGETVSYGLTRGSEPSWSRYISTDSPADRANFLTGPAGAGLGGLRAVIFGDADFDLPAFDAERDYRTVRNSAFAAGYEAKDPDISAFVNAGGKLLLWHGMDDPGPSALATIEYYEQMKAVTGARVPTLDSSVRLFVLPGVYHCRDGPGADQFDAVTAIERWVEHGEQPAGLKAIRSSDRALSRPVCQYPALPEYDGRGDPDTAESFHCR